MANHTISFILQGGVKQGDPLSSALFILADEVLSRALNSLFDDPHYVGYGLPKWSTMLNHLAYADDTINHLEINVLCSSSRAGNKTLKQEFILALHHWWFLFLRLHCNYDIVGRVRHDNSSVGLTLFHWICCLHLESNTIIRIVLPDIIVAL
ncbi:hypothetical protein MTR67_013191 [Solanum verrucosum]|uniref:Reverse transcriptase domain-containing protein n=1 Tax=Solanum verrucosum TaxID=315347 RepID=A0AAF0THP9_SOLVR|nr:hypothetical protein MTR67_013191 [Solanum verrucosum]